MCSVSLAKSPFLVFGTQVRAHHFQWENELLIHSVSTFQFGSLSGNKKKQAAEEIEDLTSSLYLPPMVLTP